MPIFELEANGKSFEVEAPNMDAALAALGGQSKPEAVAKPEPQITKRGFLVPLAEYDDNSVGLALPDIIAGPIEAAGRLMRNYRPGEVDERVAGDALSAVGLGLTGNAPRVTGEAIDQLSRARMRDAFVSVPEPQPKATPTAPAATPKDELAAASERLGIDIPRAAASDNLVTKQTSAFLKELPAVGTPLVKSSQKAIADLDAKILGLADDLGRATPQEAGQAIRSDVVDWMKQGSQAEAREIYKDVDALMLDAGGKLTKTKEAIQDIVHAADEAKLNAPDIVRTLRAAVEAPDGLSYDGAQSLRTHIGDMMSGKIAPQPGMDARALDRIYGALTEDMRNMAGAAGAAGVAKKNAKKGEAEGIAVWDKANARFRAEIADKRADLEKIIGKTGDMAPEAVVSRLITMASSKGGADLGRLQQAINVMSPRTRDDLAASIIAQMGRDKDGFSGAKFRTVYDGNLSPLGKQMLFPSRELRQALDDISTISKSFEQLARMGNPSGTGKIVFGLSGISGALAAPLPVLGTAIGGYALARLLSKPLTARKVADFSKAHLDLAQNPTPKATQAYQLAARNIMNAIDDDGDGGKPVRVNRIEDALRLPKGSQFETPDGRVKVR